MTDETWSIAADNIRKNRKITYLFAVATPYTSITRRDSYNDIEFITNLNGAIGGSTAPDNAGTVWFFKTKTDAVNARAAMQNHNIITGAAISRFRWSHGDMLDYDPESPAAGENDV